MWWDTVWSLILAIQSIPLQNGPVKELQKSISSLFDDAVKFRKLVACVFGPPSIQCHCIVLFIRDDVHGGTITCTFCCSFPPCLCSLPFSSVLCSQYRLQPIHIGAQSVSTMLCFSGSLFDWIASYYYTVCLWYLFWKINMTMTTTMMMNVGCWRQTGHFCGGQPATGDHVSTVLHQPRAAVQRPGRYSVPTVLWGFRHCLCPSSGLRRSLSHCVVNHSHRNQQIHRRLPPISGQQSTYIFTALICYKYLLLLFYYHEMSYSYSAHWQLFIS